MSSAVEEPRNLTELSQFSVDFETFQSQLWHRNRSGRPLPFCNSSGANLFDSIFARYCRSYLVFPKRLFGAHKCARIGEAKGRGKCHSTGTPIEALTLVVNAGITYTQYTQHPYKD